MKEAIATQILLGFLLGHCVVFIDGVSLKSEGGTWGGSLVSPIPPNGLSVLCSLFALYHLVSDQTLRQPLQNHVFILLFIGSIYQWKIISSMLFYHYFRNI